MRSLLCLVICLLCPHTFSFASFGPATNLSFFCGGGKASLGCSSAPSCSVSNPGIGLEYIQGPYIQGPQYKFSAVKYPYGDSTKSVERLRNFDDRTGLTFSRDLPVLVISCQNPLTSCHFVGFAVIWPIPFLYRYFRGQICR